MILNFSFLKILNGWREKRNRFLFSDDDVVCLCVVHVVLLARCILYEYSYNTTYVVVTTKKKVQKSLSLFVFESLRNRLVILNFSFVKILNGGGGRKNRFFVLMMLCYE